MQPLQILQQQEKKLNAAGNIAGDLSIASGSLAPLNVTARQSATNMALQDLYRNRGNNNSYINEFLLDGQGREPLPSAFTRCGIPRSMWDQDIVDLQAIFSAHKKRACTWCLMVSVTCGLYLITECMCEGSDARINRELLTKLDDMNRRYNKYGVVWSLKSIPGAGWFIRYET